MKTRIFNAPPTTYLICWDRNSQEVRYRDAHGEEYSEDTVNDATGFETEAQAQEKIGRNAWVACRVVPKPEWDILVYRADEYRDDRRGTIGYFLTRNEAVSVLAYKSEADFAEGDFSKITLFSVPPSVLDGIDLNNIPEMRNKSIFGNIIDTFYYT